MTEVPTTRMDARFRRERLRSPRRRSLARLAVALPGVVAHVFTHFPLRLTVFMARGAGGDAAPDGMRWVALADLHGEALPNVMRKIVVHAGLAPPPPPRATGRVSRNCDTSET